MIIYKFGGASVKDADAVKNVAKILGEAQDEHVLLVQSAMGKMTNHLEEIWRAWIVGEPTDDLLNDFGSFHHAIAESLGIPADLLTPVDGLINELGETLEGDPGQNTALSYDRVVPFGELVGTRLVAAYLEHQELPIEWLDVRNVIVTDSSHRSANVDWERSKQNADVVAAHYEEGVRKFVLTQGFIGKSNVGNTSTLGREGSDYTGAILAFLTNAQSLTIWKDVPGMLNADPKWFNNTVEVKALSFREAIELSYYGASVIHPKTIKPLQNKEIPLYVKSFVNTDHPGTTIAAGTEVKHYVPMYIFKPDQVLISISPRDFSFIVEANFRDIFEALTSSGISVNLMQNSAISFSVCVDRDEHKFERFRELMQMNYQIRYNESVELLTIRHYDEKTVDQLTDGKEVLLQQKSRHTLRMVLRQNG
ncbi:MAG: aspartate kinase [Flavobacteriales bacterium]|nr:aspartate kinase [Flavobacteriales bacterium]